MGASSPSLLRRRRDADVDDVRPGIEVVAPDRGQDAVARHDLAGVLDEVVQETELAVGQIDLALARCAPGGARGRARGCPPGATPSCPLPLARGAARAPARAARPRRTAWRGSRSPRAAKPRSLVGRSRARRHDHDRQVGRPAVQLAQHAEPVEPRQQQIEDHEVVACRAAPARDRPCPLSAPSTAKPVGLERARQKRADPGLVLYDEDAQHRSARAYAARVRRAKVQMTRR